MLKSNQFRGAFTMFASLVSSYLTAIFQNLFYRTKEGWVSVELPSFVLGVESAAAPGHGINSSSTERLS